MLSISRTACTTSTRRRSPAGCCKDRLRAILRGRQGEGRAPEGRPEPLLRNRDRDARPAEPHGHREPRDDHGYDGRLARSEHRCARAPVDAVGNILAERSAGPARLGPGIGPRAAAARRSSLRPSCSRPWRGPCTTRAPRAVAIRLLPAGAIRAPAAPGARPSRLRSPPASPKPKIEKPPPEEAPKPSKNALLLPAKEDKKKKPTPPPLVSRPGPPSPDRQPPVGRRGERRRDERGPARARAARRASAA